MNKRTVYKSSTPPPLCWLLYYTFLGLFLSVAVPQLAAHTCVAYIQEQYSQSARNAELHGFIDIESQCNSDHSTVKPDAEHALNSWHAASAAADHFASVDQTKMSTIQSVLTRSINNQCVNSDLIRSSYIGSDSEHYTALLHFYACVIGNPEYVCDKVTPSFKKDYASHINTYRILKKYYDTYNKTCPISNN